MVQKKVVSRLRSTLLEPSSSGGAKFKSVCASPPVPRGGSVGRGPVVTPEHRSRASEGRSVGQAFGRPEVASARRKNFGSVGRGFAKKISPRLRRGGSVGRKPRVGNADSGEGGSVGGGCSCKHHGRPRGPPPRRPLGPHRERRPGSCGRLSEVRGRHDPGQGPAPVRSDLDVDPRGPLVVARRPARARRGRDVQPERRRMLWRAAV